MSEIPAEGSRFWPNVRNSSQMFGKMKINSAIEVRKTGFQNFFLKEKLDLSDMHIHIPGSYMSINVQKNCEKLPNQDFPDI